MIRAAITFLIFVVHSTAHALAGRYFEWLWYCTIATLLIAIGHVVRSGVWCAIGVTWLLVGNGYWAADLLGGGEFMLTSMLTHWGGLFLGLWGIWDYGYKKGTWWRSIVAISVLQFVTRLIAPPVGNINMVFKIPDGWESLFPNHFVYYLANLLAIVVAYNLFEQGFLFFERRRGRNKKETEQPNASEVQIAQ